MPLSLLIFKAWQKIRGQHIAVILQDPMNSLNPLYSIGSQIMEAIHINQGKSKAESKKAALQYLLDVGISDPHKRFHQYPHELSGGMRQRVAIAIALACNPNVLICDEPTTSIDVTIQTQVLELIQNLKQKYHVAVIFITHDLGVVARIADRVAVIYAGQIIERGLTEEIFFSPEHPYTYALLRSLPQLSLKGEELYAIPGSPPSPSQKITGDPFAPRNLHALNIDYLITPPEFSISKTHTARTWLLDPRASDVRQSLSRKPIHAAPTCDVTGQSKEGHNKTILEISNLSVTFGKKKNSITAVDNVSFKIYEGETFGIVGESGSGKTTLGRTLMRLQNPTNGSIFFKDEKISGKLSKIQELNLAKSMQMIFQDPFSSINERSKIGAIVAEGLLNQGNISTSEVMDRVKQVLSDVGISPEFINRFPHEFSGGQLQRIGLARSIIMNPEFIIADEPVSSLDVSVRAQVLNLLNRIKKERSVTYLFISHDLSVMRYICDRIATFYKGKIIELADSETIFSSPIHPYTRSLISAIPYPDPVAERKRIIEYYDPTIHDYANDTPTLREITPGHLVLCNQQEAEKYRNIYT